MASAFSTTSRPPPRPKSSSPPTSTPETSSAPNANPGSSSTPSPSSATPPTTPPNTSSTISTNSAPTPSTVSTASPTSSTSPPPASNTGPSPASPPNPAPTGATKPPSTSRVAWLPNCKYVGVQHAAPQGRTIQNPKSCLLLGAPPWVCQGGVFPITLYSRLRPPSAAPLPRRPRAMHKMNPPLPALLLQHHRLQPRHLLRPLRSFHRPLIHIRNPRQIPRHMHFRLRHIPLVHIPRRVLLLDRVHQRIPVKPHPVVICIEILRGHRMKFP